MPCRPQDRSPTIGGVPLPLIFFALCSDLRGVAWRFSLHCRACRVGPAGPQLRPRLIPATLVPRVICLKNEGLDRLQAGFSACTPVLHLSPTCTIDSFLVQA